VHICLAAAVMAACVGGGEAQAQGKLDARYSASLAGVPIGRGAWVIEIGEDQFTAAASGMTAGLLRVFANGQGSGASRGTIRGDHLLPSVYASSIANEKRVEELRIALSSGNVKDFTIEPPATLQPERIPLTDAHRHGVTDPMTAGLVRVAGTGDPVSAEACRRTIPVFDGRMRFDLHLSFKRFERVQADSGYQGPAVVCAVQFAPLAGYVPSRPAIKYLVAQRDMEIWLTPIAGTRILVPFRAQIPTPLGLGILEATQFITVATPPRVPVAAR
jgi:Protein of unknown function (DUF3108)